ncbi:Peptidoglycan-associated lipoprotein precursor [compost metagenome]
MRALDVHAKDLKANGNRVVLEGHTDERGTREYNMALGERRAKAVQRYLVLQGVSPAQLELVSYGEERPVATGNDEQSWAQNRRVELRK